MKRKLPEKFFEQNQRAKTRKWKFFNLNQALWGAGNREFRFSCNNCFRNEAQKCFGILGSTWEKVSKINGLGQERELKGSRLLRIDNWSPRIGLCYRFSYLAW